MRTIKKININIKIFLFFFRVKFLKFIKARLVNIIADGEKCRRKDDK